MAAAGQATKREHAVLAETIDELPSDTKNLSRLTGRDLVVRTQHHDARAVGNIVEHRAHRSLDRTISTEPGRERSRIRPDGRIRWVKRGRCSASNHALIVPYLQYRQPLSYRAGCAPYWGVVGAPPACGGMSLSRMGERRHNARITGRSDPAGLGAGDLVAAALAASQAISAEITIAN